MDISKPLKSRSGIPVSDVLPIWQSLLAQLFLVSSLLPDSFSSTCSAAASSSTREIWLNTIKSTYQDLLLSKIQKKYIKLETQSNMINSCPVSQLTLYNERLVDGTGSGTTI